MNAAEKTDNKTLFEEYYRTRDKVIRNKLVENHLYMVDILVRKYMNKGIEYEDLYQVGSMGLLLAVERFDPTKGFAFTSFATPTIIGEIKRYFRDKGWALKVPRRLKEISSGLSEARDRLETQLGRKARLSELAESMGYSEEEVLEAMEGGQAYGTYSLHQTFEDRGESGEESPYEKFTLREESGYRTLENEDWLRSMLQDFDEKEKRVFQLRFIDEKSQQETAEEMGVSQMTISRMEKKMRDKLKEDYYR